MLREERNSGEKIYAHTKAGQDTLIPNMCLPMSAAQGAGEGTREAANRRAEASPHLRLL